MRSLVNQLPKMLAMLSCVLMLAGAARADKIVLKNGRKIIASTVVEAGGARAIQAARAHHAASRIEMVKGDLERALADARAAVLYAPEDPAMLLELAYVYLRRSEFKQSLEYLERAKRYAPKNPDVYKLEGWTYYGLNRPDQAATEWKKSLTLRADPEVQAALEKAIRDKAEEENYRENERAHF